MLKLPPINSKKKGGQKKTVHIESPREDPVLNIESQIFKNGTMWFELEKVAYFCKNRRKHHLQDKCKTHLGLKDLYGGEDYSPGIYEYDDMKLQQSVFRDHDPKNRIHQKMMQIQEMEESLKKKWKTIENEESNLRNLVESYDWFITLNEDKRITSQKKIEFCKEKSKDLDAKIADTRKKTDFLRNIYKSISEECEKYKHYQKFCSKAAELEGYKSATQLIMRYLSLKEAEGIVERKHNESLLQLVSFLHILNKNRTCKLEQIEFLSARCSKEKEKYRFARSNLSKHHKVLSSIQQETLMRLREIVQACVGVSNICNLIRYRHPKRKYIPLKFFDEHMAYIQANMGCIEKIYENKKFKHIEEIYKKKSVFEVSSRMEIPELVYSLNNNCDEKKQKESSSRVRLNDILKSVNEIQKWTKFEQNEDEINGNVDLQLNKMRTKFPQIIDNFDEIGSEQNMHDKTKLTDMTLTFPESLISDEAGHTVVRNVYKQNYGAPKAVTKLPKIDMKAIESTNVKDVLPASPVIKKTGKHHPPHTRQKKKSISNSKKLQSDNLNIELQDIRRHIHKNDSRTKDINKHERIKIFSISDDHSLATFSN